MKIRVVSDLHLEFLSGFVIGVGGTVLDKLAANLKGVDVLVLAGDISVNTYDQQGSHRLTLAIRQICKRFPEVVMVAGNHEYYGSTREAVWETLNALEKELPNFHPLENSTVTIKGQRFVGCTLWFPEMDDGNNARYESWLNDFRVIEGDFKGWVYKRNLESQEFLKTTVQEGDVVVTHHIPTISGVAKKWLPSQHTVGRFFLCQMPLPVLSKPKVWVYGHTHDGMRFTEGKCRFFCNPFGYWGRNENPDFDFNLDVEV